MVQKLHKYSQLRKAQSSIKECGCLMLLHDLVILESEGPHLAAVHDDPSWSQVVDVMDYLPSDFWNTAE
jgi:hypothetical protein